MTSQAIIALRISLALHLVTGGVLAGLASMAWFELPHYHLRHGSITVQASFAAAEPTSAEFSSVLLSQDLVYEPVQAAQGELEAAVTSLTRVSAEERLVHAELPKLPLELEECECEAPEHHQMQTPKRPRSDAPPLPAQAKPTAPSPVRTAVANLAVSSQASIPFSGSDQGIDVDQPPTKLASNPSPPYPADAYENRQQGRLVLEVHITAQGTVDSLRVAQSSGVPSLDQSALDTVRDWRFEPARRYGRAVATVVKVPIRFTLR